LKGTVLTGRYFCCGKMNSMWRRFDYAMYIKQPDKNVRHGESATWIICSHIIRN
jgi:hypothetical protein